MTSPKELLDLHWDGTLPVDPAKIATAMGARVIADPLMTESGMIELVNGRPVITFNSTEAPVRQRFTIAHEVGHLALGHLKDGVTRWRDPASNFSSGAGSSLEREANTFAARFLMPPQMVRYMFREEQIRDLASLAKRFGVSQAAMMYRLTNLGMLSAA